MISVIPMLFIGIGAMKGFAITTLIGTFIGVALTRPAFSIVAQKVLEGRTEKKIENKVENEPKETLDEKANSEKTAEEK